MMNSDRYKDQAKAQAAQEIIARRVQDVNWVMEAFSEMNDVQRGAWHAAFINRNEQEFLKIAIENVEHYLYPGDDEIRDVLNQGYADYMEQYHHDRD